MAVVPVAPGESLASQVRRTRKLSQDGTKAIYDLTSGVDFSNPRKTAEAIAQVVWEEDVRSWWTWKGAGPEFHPNRKVELQFPAGHHRKVLEAAKEFWKSFVRDAFGRDVSPALDHVTDDSVDWPAIFVLGPTATYLIQTSENRRRQQEEIKRIFEIMDGYIIVSTP